MDMGPGQGMARCRTSELAFLESAPTRSTTRGSGLERGVGMGGVRRGRARGLGAGEQGRGGSEEVEAKPPATEREGDAR
jgi:hypothetical protein